jgi:hypothetical protein
MSFDSSVGPEFPSWDSFASDVGVNAGVNSSSVCSDSDADASSDLSIYHSRLPKNERASVLTGDDRLRVLSRRFDAMLGGTRGACLDSVTTPKVVGGSPAAAYSPASVAHSKYSPASLAHSKYSPASVAHSNAGEAAVHAGSSTADSVGSESQTDVPAIVPSGTSDAAPRRAHSANLDSQTRAGSQKYYQKEEEFWHERERQLTLLLRCCVLAVRV